MQSIFFNFYYLFKKVKPTFDLHNSFDFQSYSKFGDNSAIIYIQLLKNCNLNNDFAINYIQS
jgi:hypothetical protein